MEALEIPVITRISDFEATLNQLRNPSFVSRFVDLVSIDGSFLNYNLWTWGALILAILAAFSGVINRTKLLILRLYQRYRSVDSENLLLRPLVDEDDEDDSSDDDDDESCSSSSSIDEDDEPSSPFGNQRLFDEDFRVAGSSNLRRRFSWSDFASGKSVVKFWDGLGLGLKFDGSSNESVVSMWDWNNNEIIDSFHGSGESQIPSISRSSAAAVAAPSVVLTAGMEECGNKALIRVWDARLGRQIPAIFADWQPRWKSVTVRDVRKIGTPIESEEDTWWDADAVMVSDADREFDGTKKLSPVRSVVSRCRDAVKFYMY